MKKITKEILMYSLAAIVTIGFFVLLYILIFVEIKLINKEILMIVIGALMGSFATIINYFFGSSAGSAEKTKIMNEQNENNV